MGSGRAGARTLPIPPCGLGAAVCEIGVCVCAISLVGFALLRELNP
jgi:hypothetical protein